MAVHGLKRFASSMFQLNWPFLFEGPFMFQALSCPYEFFESQEGRVYYSITKNKDLCICCLDLGKLRTLSHVLVRNTKFEILDAHEEILLFIHVGFLHLAETHGNCVKAHTCLHCDHLLFVSLPTPNSSLFSKHW